MATGLNPYINFKTTARPAMEFYRSVFGGELTINTFGDYQMDGLDPEGVMHSRLVTPSGFTLMGADTPEGMPWDKGNDIAIALFGDDSAELHRYWDALSDGADIITPLAAQMWGDEFGQLTDKFGTGWMVNISGSTSA